MLLFQKLNLKLNEIVKREHKFSLLDEIM